MLSCIIRFLLSLVVSDTIRGLLILQDRFDKVAGLEAEISRLPQEIQKLEQKITDEEAHLDGTIKELKELEVRRKDLELEVESAEAQIGRYKNQQLEVKKNEEYRALTHEIELTEEKISDLETRELEIMEAMDEKNAELDELKVEVQKQVDYQRKLIGECEHKLENLKAELSSANSAFDEQKSTVGEADFRLFEGLSRRVKRPPYIVELTGQNCGGCHMRVSNDVLKKAKMGEITYCDQCSRLVYFDS
ncbi:MAG: C4-type zinc ribbon domain-containing protein [Opitutales bacterium]|nr:C4-type zinc ribbon domain-containing protein [Opitutales bacterium]